MRRLALSAFLVIGAAPAFASVELAPLRCLLTQSCPVGEACAETEAEFDLTPVPGGYGASIDAGYVEIMQVSPPEAEVRSFLLSTPQSVTVLLSLFPDGAVALTIHEDIDGRYVETAYGTCAEDT